MRRLNLYESLWLGELTCPINTLSLKWYNHQKQTLEQFKATEETLKSQKMPRKGELSSPGTKQKCEKL